MVNKLTAYISGSLIDHVFIKKTLMKKFCINVTIEDITFQIMILYDLQLRKVVLIFKLLHKIQFDQDQAAEKNLMVF